MRICVLEHPRVASEDHFNDIANTPLWSCLMGRYAAGSLMAEGHLVTWLDAVAGGLDFDRTRRHLLKAAPDLLAVNAVYFWEHTPRLLDFIAGLKARRPSMHITLFGFFPSLAYEQVLALCPAVDSVCVGECETTLTALADAIAGGGADWRSIAGLAYNKDGGIVFPAVHQPAPDPDSFAFPFHPEAAVDEDETAAVLASRGCYNHCAFCPIPPFYNRGALWRGRSPENILQEVVWLMEKGYRRFYFVDPNFIGPGRAGRRRILDLMAALAPLKIRFGMETRPNDLDEELLQVLTGAGLDSLLLGVESGSRKVLDHLSKHASLDSSGRAIALCRQAGIEPEVGFLMHIPDATVADLNHNLAFLERHALLDRLDRTANLLCHRQIVFRGTPGFDRYRRQDRILGTDGLGFEARIAWKDPRAAWVADVMVPVCLDVLRQTGDPQSPLFWKSAFQHRETAKRVNDRLVEGFRRTLALAGRAVTLPAVESQMDFVREWMVS